MGQSQMVEAEKVEDGCVQVIDGDWILLNAPADVVRPADDLPPLDPSTGHEDTECEGVMVPARIDFLRASVVFRQWGATEFSSPDDESLIQQAALLQVLQKGGHRLVNDPTVDWQLIIETAVVIPGGVINVNEPDAPFHQAARQQAVAGIGRKYPPA